MPADPTSIESLTQEVETLRQRVAELEQQLQQREQQQTAVEQSLQELKRTQSQLVQREKMSSLELLVAGVAHEINNPINFIHGNINPASESIQDLLELLQLYQAQFPNSTPEIHAKVEEIDLEFLSSDLPKLLSSMKFGAERIREIVHCLRVFSRLDEAEVKAVNIHEGIDSALLILRNRLITTSARPAIQVIRDYDKLPKVECYARQLNQVFMNILCNAIDALDKSFGLRSTRSRVQELSQALKPNLPSAVLNLQSAPTIWIRTQSPDPQRVIIRIADNGPGMTETVRQQMFDPFFTTKSVGKGTGLGLSISYQIVTERHQGRLECVSAVGQGTELVIEIPTRQSI